MEPKTPTIVENSIDREIVTVLEHSGLEKTQAESVMEGFKIFFEDVKSYENEAKSIVVTDATQVSEIKRARELRLNLKNVRVNAEKVRKERKEFFLRGGKAIDGLANVLKALIVPLEEHLDAQENFAVRIETERKDKLGAQRVEDLRPYVSEEMLAVYTPGLRDMTEGAFEILLKNSKKAFEEQQEAEKQAEEARIKAEEDKKAEDERIRAENERLRIVTERAGADRQEAEDKAAEAEKKRKEAEERERQALAEKKKAEDDLKAQQEKEEKEKQERERKEKEEADRIEREKKEKEEAEKQEAEAKAKRERADNYRASRAEHGWTEETKGDFYEQADSEKVVLYKKVGVFNLK